MFAWVTTYCRWYGWLLWVGYPGCSALETKKNHATGSQQLQAHGTHAHNYITNMVPPMMFSMSNIPKQLNLNQNENSLKIVLTIYLVTYCLKSKLYCLLLSLNPSKHQSDIYEYNYVLVIRKRKKFLS